MLPQSIVEKLKKSGDADKRFAASFPETSILFGAGGVIDEGATRSPFHALFLGSLLIP